LSTTFPFTSPYKLKETSFDGGSTQDFVFAVYDSYGNPVNLSGGTMAWYLSYFSDPATSVVSVNGTSGSATNIFKVHIPAATTVGLDGKFMQQYNVVDSSGSSYRSSGLVTIFPAAS
jgi:hypothetical protein